MFDFDEFEKQKYNDVFNKVYKSMKESVEKDREYGINEVKSLLESLYKCGGHDWLGRGKVYEITNSATIAACEAILSELETGKI